VFNLSRGRPGPASCVTPPLVRIGGSSMTLQIMMDTTLTRLSCPLQPSRDGSLLEFFSGEPALRSGNEAECTSP
jgi:hypothetical protein